MEKVRIEFREILNQMAMSKYFSTLSQVVYFQRPCLKKRYSQMEKGRIEFSIKSLEPGGNSEPNGYVQVFFSINSNCAFSKTI